MVCEDLQGTITTRKKLHTQLSQIVITGLLIVVLAFNLSAQTVSYKEKADSLAKKLVTLELISSENLNSALTLSKQIRKQAEILQIDSLKWKSVIAESKIRFDLGQKDTAIVMLNEIYTQSVVKKDTSFQINILCTQSDFYQDDYNLKNAIQNLMTARKLLTNSSSFDLRFTVLFNLAKTHRKLKDYTTALQYYDILANRYFFQLSLKQRFLVYMNTGNVYGDLKKYDKTEVYFQKAYEEITKLGTTVDLARITYNMGTLYYRKKKYAQATEFVEKSLKSYSEIGDRLRQELCYRVLGAINYDQSNYQQAEQYYLQALAIAQEIKNPKSILGNYKNLYHNYKELSLLNPTKTNLQKAFDYQKKWEDLNDSIYQADLANQLLEMESKYQAEKKDAQIKQLENENRLKAEELWAEQQARNYLILFVVLLLSIIGIVIYSARYYRRVNRQLQLQGKTIFDQKEQIVSQNIELQKSVDVRNKLFRIIAHDLRSPLISVSNFMHLLKIYLPEGKLETILRMADEIGRKNEQVLELTDNLLNWTESQSGALKPQLQRICLNEVLDECFDLYLPIANRKGIDFRMAEKDDCQIWADRNMVRTICRNLVNNAIKFTPAGGVVSLNYECKAGLAWVRVSDNGIGLSKEKQEKLFIPDQKETRQGTAGEKSNGLGLSVCKEFAQLLNGEITVESEEAKGSTFSFSVPVYLGEEESLTPSLKNSLKQV